MSDNDLILALAEMTPAARKSIVASAERKASEARTRRRISRSIHGLTSEEMTTALLVLDAKPLAAVLREARAVREERP